MTTDLIREIADITDTIERLRGNSATERAIFAKDNHRTLFSMGQFIGHDDPAYPMLRDTIKRMYRICFEIDENTIEQIVVGKGFPA